MAEEKNENVKEMKDKVDNLTTINFSVTKCPLKVYRKFVEFCKEESNDNYSMGLKLLLDGIEGNVKEATLFQEYMEVKERLVKVEAELNQLKKPVEEEKKPKLKTMGSGGL